MKKKHSPKPPIPKQKSSVAAAPEVSETAEKPWFYAGLSFECRECGRCCTGAPGYVWVSDEEIDALCGHLSMNFEEFEEVYVRKVGRRKSLREFQNYDCVFFDHFHQNCKIYTFRPRQCRSWPFWNSNLESEESWESVARGCPGCGHGEPVPLEEIMSRMEMIDL